MTARSFAYDKSILRSVKISGINVISIGNLTMGGSGKTPLTIYLAQTLSNAGKKVAVISRGYKGKMEHTGGLVSDGNGPIRTAEQAGDEPYLIATQLKDVQVRVGANREIQIKAAQERGAEIALLDDGFSHRRIHRDLDILLAKPEELLSSARFFPDGRLRELPKSASRAHLIGGFEDDWKEEKSADADFTFSYVTVGLSDAGGQVFSVDELLHCPVHILCGIARPERFVCTVTELGFHITGKSFFRDHYRITNKDIKTVFDKSGREGAKIVLTTEKDMVRIPAPLNGMPMFAVKIEPHIVSGKDKLIAACLNAVK